MNANLQATGPGTGPDPSDRGHVHLHDSASQLAATNAARNVHHVLLELQRQFGAFGKDSNGHNYKYVSLGKILDQVRPVLVANDCLMMHTSELLSGSWMMATEICHIPSDTRVGTTFITQWAEMKGMSNPQTSGAYETYARRYNILKLLNCAIEDDDAADVYRQVMRDMDDAKTKEEIRKILGAAKTKIPKREWAELVEIGKGLVDAIEKEADHADPISE